MTADALILALPGMKSADAGGLTRDAVEALFQRLTSRTLGMPIPTAELPPEREFAAALIILRECMHHLGFDRISGVAEPTS